MQTLEAITTYNGGYTHYAFVLNSAASGNNDLKLTFTSEDDNAYLYLDDVSLTEYFPPPPPAATPFLVNGGFETGTFYGWTIGPDCDNSDEVGSYNVHSGSYSAQLNSYPAVCTLTQDVTLKHGKSYLLSFWLLNTYDYYYPALFTLTTQLANNTVLQFSQTQPFNYNGYTYFQYSYIVTAPMTGAHTLGLTFGSDSESNTFYLDDVSLTQLGKGYIASSSAAPLPSSSSSSLGSSLPFFVATGSSPPPAATPLVSSSSRKK
jgi:hypothetical protein